MAAFTLHRELEVYTEAGIPAAAVLKMATLVMKGDTLYRPDELYPAVGVKPFLPSEEL